VTISKGGVRVAGLKGADGDTLRFSSKGSELFSASGGSLAIWDAQSGRRRLTLKGYAGEVDDWLPWPGGRILITGCASGRVQLWDRRTGRLLRTYAALHVPVFALARFSSRLVAVGANYDDLRYWNCEPRLHRPPGRDDERW